jgi:hypothetical protein
MADEPTNGAKPARRQLSDALIEQLRRAVATYGSGEGHDADVSRALRAIGAEARVNGVQAEQLVASLKRIFDNLTPPPTLASQEARAKRLAHLVTLCVHEYYTPTDESGPSEPSRSS